MSKDKFVERWKTQLAGLALFGVASEVHDGTMVRASKILEIPGQVEKLLAKLYEDAQPNAVTSEDLVAMAKLMGDAERRKFRQWIESQPKQTDVKQEHRNGVPAK